MAIGAIFLRFGIESALVTHAISHLVLLTLS
jgi:hypothetical protein